MAAMEPLCVLIGIKPSKLTNQEKFLLESEIFLSICEELKEVFRKQHKEYFYLMKFTFEKENAMLDANLARLIIQDIILTGEYNFEGISRYTHIHEDVLQEIYAGKNLNPSVTLFRKILELHRMVRPELYQKISAKILEKSSQVA